MPTSITTSNFNINTQRSYNNNQQIPPNMNDNNIIVKHNNNETNQYEYSHAPAWENGVEFSTNDAAAAATADSKVQALTLLVSEYSSEIHGDIVKAPSVETPSTRRLPWTHHRRLLRSPVPHNKSFMEYTGGSSRAEHTASKAVSSAWSTGMITSKFVSFILFKSFLSLLDKLCLFFASLLFLFLLHVVPFEERLGMMLFLTIQWDQQEQHQRQQQQQQQCSNSNSSNNMSKSRGSKQRQQK